MTTSKLTIDLTDENREILETIKSVHKIPYGNMINELIGTFCEIPSEISEELIEFIKLKRRQIQTEMLFSLPNRYRYLENIQKSYTRIASFLNNGTDISLEIIDINKEMKKIPLKDGYLICPVDWKIINPTDSTKMMYAGVIECNNAIKYNIPCYVFFTDKKYDGEYSVEYTTHIQKMCATVYPEFQEIIDNQITPINDPNRPGLLLNGKEWMDAPTIGFFHIYEQGDERYGTNYEPPAGARIVRTNNQK